MANHRKGKIHLSKLYSFSCFRPHFEEEHSQIGQKGYSRVVYCNDPENPVAISLKYGDNYVSTTKYTALTFIPKSLFEQFRRVANFYFLVVAAVSFSPLAPYKGTSVLYPLLGVIGITMAKEGIEDLRRRRQDTEVNNRNIHVCGRNHTFYESRWKNLRVGDIVKVYKDQFFPADLILLSSSFQDGICYVETMNLDGETNLKLKHALDATVSLQDEMSFRQFNAVINCEDPNEDLYSFVGRLNSNGQQYPLSLKQMLLRDSRLRNTDYVYGVVVFTGHDTKVMRNTRHPPSKRSKIEKRMDKIIFVLFSILISMAFIGSVFFGLMTRNDIDHEGSERWYLQPRHTSSLYNPKKPILAAFLHFLTCLMLYGYLIPISLYISIELVKVLQSIFIDQDQSIYYEVTNEPARARTSNLNEELGQVDTVLSDKTGTLTSNSMEFVKCSISGIAYGHGSTEVERSLTNRVNGSPKPSDISSFLPVSYGGRVESGKSVKGFNFSDERIMNGMWIKEPHSDMIQKFFRVLAICHTVVPDVNKDLGEISYEAESPDEAAFVIAAREFGFEFFERTQTSISLHELDYESGKKVIRSYKILHVIEFTSNRKRMSIILRDPENQLLLLCKGADSVMFGRLSRAGKAFEVQTKNHINKYAEAGLRTLVVAYRELDEAVYKMWEEEFLKAKNSVTIDRDELLDAAADKIERELLLLGATAVEDKLQKGVPECVNKLRNAGIKIWVLTGDKMETAVNVGYACSLLKPEMKQIVITLDSTEINALEKRVDRDTFLKACDESVKKQIREGRSLLDSTKRSTLAFALIIDGRSLAFALNKNLESSFLELAIDCASVICCRSTPKQKALVTRMVKYGTGKTTLAIGDGANDVGMLQEADIGVGISGAEGMQAVMSSDFSIAQFRFLERLLLVHGHWCYRRIAMMICYFFYKNITFGTTLFWFEAQTSFSGKPAYNDWFMACYSVFFTSLPVIALGVFDQDVSARLCQKYPMLYQEGAQNLLFKWPRILGWMFNGVLSSIIIFFICTMSSRPQAFRADGQPVDYEVLGATMYSCVVWAVNCQMAICINYFTWVQHIFIWGSIASWYAFLVIYGYTKPVFSTTAYRVLLEACGPSPFYWMVTLLVVVSTLLPYILYRLLQSRFYPMYHDVIQRSRIERSEVEMLRELPARVKEKMSHVSLELRQINREAYNI